MAEHLLAQSFSGPEFGFQAYSLDTGLLERLNIVEVLDVAALPTHNIGDVTTSDDPAGFPCRFLQPDLEDQAMASRRVGGAPSSHPTVGQARTRIHM